LVHPERIRKIPAQRIFASCRQPKQNEVKSNTLGSFEGGKMRNFLINKNLCLHYWLRKRIGKERASKVSSMLEKVILVFGRPIL
jgi:hypothetical protein